MMEEMKNKLASRRRNTEAAGEEPDLPSPAKQQQPPASPLVKTRPQLGASPGLGRAASSLARLEVVSASRGLELVRGAHAQERQQLDTLKEDILREIRAEIEKSKLEIIQIIRSELQNK